MATGTWEDEGTPKDYRELLMRPICDLSAAISRSVLYRLLRSTVWFLPASHVVCVSVHRRRVCCVILYVRACDPMR